MKNLLIVAGLLCLQPLVESQAVTYVVTNTLPSGPGSLSAALENAATNYADVSRVTFAIPGTPPFVISPTSVLNVLYGNVTVDGTTQPGWSNNYPAVVINGSSLPGFADCFDTYGTNNLIRGLRIQNFGANAIRLNRLSDPAGWNRVEGCHLIGNAVGIEVYPASNNVIGGFAVSNRNVVSANTNTGIMIEFSSGNMVAGNWVGVSPTNSAVAMGNAFYGIWVYARGSNSIIGSGGAQVISGNGNAGIQLESCDANIVQGNFVGCDSSGTVAVSNRYYGINVQNSSYNTIGGTNSVLRNLVSGNYSGTGINLTYSSHDNVIQGNYVGVSAFGLGALPNWDGIYLQSGADNNLVGGTNSGAGNLISGNILYGLSVWTSNNVIQGNSIGLSALGTTTISNGSDGAFIYGWNNLVGGTNPAARNFICGNGTAGINLGGISNVVQGNLIGVDSSGNRLPNYHGIYLAYASDALIGGTSTNARNVISGNNFFGIYTDDSAKDSVIQGNYIGMAPNGSTVASNNYDGIRVYSSTNITIGGSVAGAGNLIAGNGQHQIDLITGSCSNTIAGNLIGVAADGATLRTGGPGYNGIYVGGPANRIGGLTAQERNVIAGSLSGSSIVILGASNNVVQGNYMGVASNGVTTFTNAQQGVYLAIGAAGNVIGGTNSGARNVIAGQYAAVYCDGGISNSILGNYLGFNAAGNLAVTSTQFGVEIVRGAWNSVGSTAQGAGNVIYGKQCGVDIVSTNSHHNTVQGNIVNLDPAGNIITSNLIDGISISFAQSNLIGGATAGARNVIFDNNAGIQFWQSNAVGNVAQGNYIGVGPDGYSPRKFPTNSGTGIHVFLTRGGNTIGGTNAGEGNIIAYHSYGVIVFGSNATRTAICGNTIYSNVWNGAPHNGIDLAPEGTGADNVTPNDPVPDADIGPNNLQNFPVITNAVSELGSTRVQGYLASTTNAKFRIEFFYSDTTNAEGRFYLGATNIATANNGTGTFSAVLGGYAATSKYITATATDTNGNTSEFCPGVIKPSPAVDTDGDGMPDYWETQYGLNPSFAGDATNSLDADGVPNLAEYIAGTAPNNGTSYLRVTQLTAGGTNVISFPSSQFRNYNLEVTVTPTNNATWSILYSNVLGSGLTIDLKDGTTSTAECYRVRALIP